LGYGYQVPRYPYSISGWSLHYSTYSFIIDPRPLLIAFSLGSGPNGWRISLSLIRFTRNVEHVCLRARACGTIEVTPGITAFY